MAHFSPWGDRQPCWWCVHWDGIDSSGAAALCKSTRGCRVRSQPEYGCSMFEREAGCDDEPNWNPIKLVNASLVQTKECLFKGSEFV